MKAAILILLLLPGILSIAQDSVFIIKDPVSISKQTTTSTINKNRIRLLVGANLIASSGSITALYNTWYKGYPSSKFHFFNDNDEWMQMDKLGHVWSAYNIGRITAASWKWAGFNREQSTWVGGFSGVAYQTIIEVFDGFSSQWGFSWGDFASNIAGGALYVAQEFKWKEQRIQVKFSFHRNDYNPIGLNARADSLFGKGFLTRMLKDYNGQTYWFSFNLHSFFKEAHLPPWFNIAIGHGADGMFGGSENLTKDKNGTIIFDRRDIPRYRRWHIAPDIDLTKIKTKSKFLKTTFLILNSFKFPAPSLELSQGKLKWNWIQF